MEQGQPRERQRQWTVQVTTIIPCLRSNSRATVRLLFGLHCLENHSKCWQFNVLLSPARIQSMIRSFIVCGHASCSWLDLEIKVHSIVHTGPKKPCSLLTFKMNHLKLIVLSCLCAVLVPCVFSAWIENKGRVDVVISFDECKVGNMDPTKKTIILKPGNAFNFTWNSFFLGIFLTGVKCYIYVLGPSPRPPQWSNLIDTITINRPGGITSYDPYFLKHCQQPCRVQDAPDYSFIIL